MRQGNGSDLLGANDPRSATIGIVYVAPNDDRESVQAAILTQEKLGREQIAIVLPNQNRAFHQAVDFDGLKNMRGKLQARLVLIAPPGSGPADFARQRRLPYFTSLESYGRSLRDESSTARAARSGRWPFNRRQGLMRTLPTPGETPVEQAPAAAPGVGIPLEAASAAAMVDEQAAESLSADGAASAEEDDVALPAPPPQDETRARGSEPDTMQPPPGPEQKKGDAASPDGGTIITFPASKPHSAELAAVQRVDEEDAAADDTPTLVPQGGKTRRSSGKTPSVVAPAPVAARSRVTAKLPVPVAGGNPPGTAGGGRRRGGWLAILLLLLLASLVLCATVAYAAPNALPTPVHNFFSSIAGGGTPSATVTITPRSADELNTYVLTGVTSGTPDRAKRQVQVRLLKVRSHSQSKTVDATGLVDTPSVQATGSLTFYNGNASAYTVKAQTMFTDASGVSVENDSAVVIPAGSPASGYGRVSASASAVSGGSRGNIAAGDFSLMQCCGSGSVFVSNGSFGGGQDPQHFRAVQQSDIDGAANPLKQPLLQSTRATLNAEKRVNEQFVARPGCAANVSSSQAAGARATQVTVTVSATCVGQVYDQSAAQSIAADLLKTKAAHELDPHYVLSGSVTTGVTRTTTDPQGNLILFVKAEGTWVYQFTDAQKSQLAQHIKGISTKDALVYLQAQPGVGQVTISVSGGTNTNLPADPNAITIVVGNAPGVQRQATPTSGQGAATPSQGPPAGVTPTLNPGSGITPPATPLPSPSVGGS